MVGERHAAHADTSRREQFEPDNRAQHRRLPSAVGAEQCGDLAGAAVNETSRSTGTPPLCLTADSTVTAVPTAPAVPTGTTASRTGLADTHGLPLDENRMRSPGWASDATVGCPLALRMICACQATKQTACGVDAHRCKIGVSCRARSPSAANNCCRNGP